MGHKDSTCWPATSFRFLEQAWCLPFTPLPTWAGFLVIVEWPQASGCIQLGPSFFHHLSLVGASLWDWVPCWPQWVTGSIR